MCPADTRFLRTRWHLLPVNSRPNEAVPMNFTFRRGTWGSKGLNNLPEVTQELKVRAQFQFQSFCSKPFWFWEFLFPPRAPGSSNLPVSFILQYPGLPPRAVSILEFLAPPPASTLVRGPTSQFWLHSPETPAPPLQAAQGTPHRAAPQLTPKP